MAGPRRWWSAALASVALALTLAACTTADSGPSAARSVRFLAEDGLVLQGRVYGSGSPGVVLAHALDSDQSAWRQFAESLAARGYRVLTFDFRGHGTSPGEKEIGVVDSDLAGALRFMREQLQRPRAFLIGASMGGTAALRVASREDVLGVATLSAPLSIRGLSANPGLERITAPKLFIAAEGDSSAAQDARRLFALARDPKQVELVKGSAHGTDLLAGSQGDAIRNLLLTFLDKNRS